MKVKDLILELSEADPEAEVILQKDAEGNGYSPLADVGLDEVYIPDSPYSGEVYSTALTAEEAGMDEPEWAAIATRPRCVVLAPVN